MVRALDWSPKVEGLNPCQDHKKNFDFLQVRKVVLSVDYGNTEITSMHLSPRRRNVAAHMAEELRTVTYVTPPMEERRKQGGKKYDACSEWSVPSVTQARNLTKHYFGHLWILVSCQYFKSKHTRS